MPLGEILTIPAVLGVITFAMFKGKREERKERQLEANFHQFWPQYNQWLAFRHYDRPTVKAIIPRQCAHCHATNSLESGALFVLSNPDDNDSDTATCPHFFTYVLRCRCCGIWLIHADVSEDIRMQMDPNFAIPEALLPYAAS
ncbi:hypothetical protein KKA01_00785 [Patescibacteria group bacterium]|nr:hypothetical protein [Patescibacteria group bacterium]